MLKIANPDLNRKVFLTKEEGLTNAEIKRHQEFLKIREGETQSEWEKRTKSRRFRSEQDFANNLSHKKKIIVNKKRKKTDYAEYRKKYYRFYISEKIGSFLKHYAVVMAWAEIKYGIPKEDLEIGFMFYNETKPFTKEQFTNRTLLLKFNSSSIFNRFFKNKYLNKLTGGEKLTEDDFFMLNSFFMMKINAIYDKITLFNGFTNQELSIIHNKEKIKNNNESLFNEMKRMNDERKDFKAGFLKVLEDIKTK